MKIQDFTNEQIRFIRNLPEESVQDFLTHNYIDNLSIGDCFIDPVNHPNQNSATNIILYKVTEMPPQSDHSRHVKCDVIYVHLDEYGDPVDANIYRNLSCNGENLCKLSKLDICGFEEIEEAVEYKTNYIQTINRNCGRRCYNFLKNFQII